MTNRPSRTVLDRLRAVDWSDETSAFGREHSRALLMREFLRRSALWARACGAEEAWPFFDVAEHVDAEVHAPADVAAEVEELVQGLAPESLRTTCRAAVRWACLGDARTESTAGLPDPYEPLLLLFERGGGFYLEEYLDLNGVMIPLGTVETNASVPPFLTLAPATLDALDAEGEITYYAKIDERHPRQSPRGIVRRRIDEDGTYDEAFTRNLRWEPTEYLKLYALGHDDIDHVPVCEHEAAAFIESVAHKLTGGGQAM
ncbi:hypothetical protein GCM10010347_63980 [Streptomyces cirratus]|uniref:DUF4240 domain-containing protein n=1 Tax=Streptomyces cirratus TaxID=68187 RepID=A0ABQ3F547_9ACTN|nr:hypothetical protein [Streptomyces cirratus]GHB84273.1 hypothetical protein GCM10010347_63980 [Streptomyces cirratus]